jgi:uncharacterized protein (DUF1015 family)
MPFKAIRYNSRVIQNQASVVAPPYDVIPPAMQEDLYLAHQNNVVRLILNKIENTDTASENRYTRASRYFETWLNDGILVKDNKEAFYIYSQAHNYGGKNKEQIGFIGLMELDMSGKKVLPHENTLAAPKTDRLNLMREIRANLSPIFVLYDDSRHEIVRLMKKFCRKARPVTDVVFEGVRSRLWRLSDEKLIKRMKNFMSAKSVFIADGHHRYEVARMYAKQAAKEKLPKNIKDNSKRIMVYFLESDEKMLTILPAHRLAKDVGFLVPAEILKRLSGYFTVSKIKDIRVLMSKLASTRSHVFGMRTEDSKTYLLKLKDRAASDKAIKNKPRAWKKLDVAILHNFILQHVLKINDSEENIEFVKDPEETAMLVDEGKFKIAFFLNPTKAKEIKEIARIGEKMPRKATYFYPKPLSGLVISKF